MAVLIAIFVVLLRGRRHRAWRYAFEPGVTRVMLVVGLWALFNLLIAGAALGVVAERREARRHPRLTVARRGRVCFEGYAARCSDRERVGREGVQSGFPRRTLSRARFWSEDRSGSLGDPGADGHGERIRSMSR